MISQNLCFHKIKLDFLFISPKNFNPYPQSLDYEVSDNLLYQREEKEKTTTKWV